MSGPSSAALVAAIKAGDERGVRKAVRGLPTDWFLDNVEGLLRAAQAASQFAVMEVLRDLQIEADQADDEAMALAAEMQASMQAARQAAKTNAVPPTKMRMDAHVHVGEATEMEAKRKHAAYDPLKKMVANESDNESGWSSARSSRSRRSNRSQLDDFDNGKAAGDDGEGSDGGESAWTEYELQDELDDMLDAVTGDILGDADYRVDRSRRLSGGGAGSSFDELDGPEPEHQLLELGALSVAQLKQLIARLGGEEQLPKLALEKRELVGCAAKLLGTAPLVLIDELFREMGFAGFKPGGEGDDGGADVLSRWAGDGPGGKAGGGGGGGATSVMAAAERRIQLHELTRRQLRALLVKLGGADSGGAHLTMDKQQLLKAAREAMGQAPLVLLDEACVELQVRAEAARAAGLPPAADSDETDSGGDDGGGSDDESEYEEEPTQRPAPPPQPDKLDSARRIADARLKRHRARVDKLKGTGVANAAAAGGGGGGLLKVGAAPKAAAASGMSRVERLAAGVVGNGGGGVGDGSGAAAAATPEQRGCRSSGKTRGSRSAGGARGKAAAEAEAAAAAKQQQQDEAERIRLFDGLKRVDDGEADVSLGVAPKAEAPHERFDLYRIPAPKLERLLKKLGGRPLPPPPPKAAQGTGSISSSGEVLAAQHQAALVAALRDAMGEAPLALVDEVCAEIETISKALKGKKSTGGATKHRRGSLSEKLNADGTPRQARHDRHGKSSDGGEAGGGGGGGERRHADGTPRKAQARRGSRTNLGTGTGGATAGTAAVDGTPRHRRKSTKPKEGDAAGASASGTPGMRRKKTTVERQASKLEKRVAEALDEDREAVELARAERELEARLNAAGVGV